MSSTLDKLHFYSERGEDITFCELDGLLNSNQTLVFALAKVFYLISRVMCGHDDPKLYLVCIESRTKEPLYASIYKKAAILYAVQPVQGSRLKTVTALRICETARDTVNGRFYLDQNDINTANERLFRLRTGA